ncbi:hypothetical protein HMPREF1870_01395 [Bacteroidales bacterium KA00344]|nr:hypothetical protein HMPREF1870_01395 [Bacteroidales bacterium KA00344]
MPFSRLFFCDKSATANRPLFLFLHATMGRRTQRLKDWLS